MMIDVVDDEWRVDKLPKEDIAVPIQELPPVGEDLVRGGCATGSGGVSDGTQTSRAGQGKGANFKLTLKQLENRWGDQGLSRLFDHTVNLTSQN